MNKKTNIKNSKNKNLILQQYLASSTNAVICVDITKLGINGELFLAVDLASRCIVGHCYKSSHICTHDICLTIQQFNQKRAFLPKIEIIHSDRESLFTNNQYLLFLDSLNIEHSVGSSKGNQNQVVERLNRSIKDIIRVLLDNNWKSSRADPLKDFVEPKYLADIVLQAIELYNNRPHKALNRLTPNDMEAALFQKHQQEHPKELKLLTKNNGSPEAIAMQQYKNTIIQEYQGNWEQFFIDWKLKQEKQHNEVVTLIKKKAAQAQKEAQQQAERARMQYNTLYEQFLDIQQKMQILQEEAEFQRKLREDKQLKKLKRNNAKKADIRQTISPEDFEIILNLTKGKKFVRQRRRLAFVLLYLTGLRVSNLLLLKVFHLKELIERGKTNISIIKKGPKRHDIGLSQKGHSFLKLFINDFHVLAENKTKDMPLFSALNQPDKVVSIDNFEKELNRILKGASGILEKHIRTHSFRATVITELLQSTPIEDVAEYMGHRAISSTLEYKRSRLSITQIKKISAKRHFKKINFLKKSK